MRFRTVLLALAAPLLAAGLAAQPCIQVCTSSNWGQTHNPRRFTATTIAVRVPGLTRNDTICQIEFFCYTRNAQPVNLPVWIYDRAASGQPGTVIASGSMLVGTAAGPYTARVQAPVQANTDFFFAFDNAVGNLAPPLAMGGPYGGGYSEHWHSGPPTWSGPYASGPWIYQLYSSSGTVQGQFSTAGQGCVGRHGVPRIGSVGSPVIGTVFQVTLAQAPSRTPVVHVLGLSSNQIDLGPFGAPGCTLEQLPLVTFGAITGSTGAASFPYSVPANPSLLGSRLHMQWAVFDPTANPLGTSVSPGGVATIGDF